MSDFTKEELEIIRTLINNTDEKVLTSSEGIMTVQSKVQWLIDNYCEHESDGSFCVSNSDIDKCTKCGEFYR